MAAASLLTTCSEPTEELGFDDLQFRADPCPAVPTPAPPTPSCTDPTPELPNPVSWGIEHADDWQGEYDLHDYNPAFSPNPVEFDADNLPAMRSFAAAQDGVLEVQRPGSSCNWLTEDDIADAFDNHNPVLTIADEQLNIQGMEQRVVFDSDNDGYLVVPLTGGTQGLAYYNDSTDTWTAYQIPTAYDRARLEYKSSHNLETGRPPAIMLTKRIGSLGQNDAEVAVLMPIKVNDVLSFPSAIVLDTDAHWQGGGFAANPAVSTTDYTFVTWAAQSASSDAEDIMVARYDHGNGTMSAEYKVGETPKKDPHITPSLLLGSDDKLHLFYGAGSSSQIYRRSTGALTYTSWEAEEVFGENSGSTHVDANVSGDVSCGGNQYCSTLSQYVDSCKNHVFAAAVMTTNAQDEDTLHVVSKWSGTTHCPFTQDTQRLVYLRKEEGQAWDERLTILQPFERAYSMYYQRLSVDRDLENVFLYYSYYKDQMTADAATCYESRWTADIDDLPDTVYGDVKQYVANPGGFDPVEPHDPVLWISDDEGDSFRLATTADLLYL